MTTMKQMANQEMAMVEWRGLGALERPRYYPRQLITPDEMNLEVKYYRDMMRRHNRMLHGWGVVAGAAVCAVANRDKTGTEPYMVKVTPGYILGPYGDEIIIPRERTFDLRTGSAVGSADESVPGMADPYCTPVTVQKIEGTAYVSVRYKEIKTRQVRVQPAACGCDDSPCEYSRICDGYEFGTHNCCASPTGAVTTPEELLERMFLSYEDSPASLPGDMTSDWVTLAKVTLDSDGYITAIDNCSCRRMVATLAHAWRTCETKMFEVEKIEPYELEQGWKREVKIYGSNLS
ncbi:MAG: hypothetical protein EHM21_13680, partial [Chloroflexi bacterium]